VRKIIERGKSTGLLELEESKGFLRPQHYAETAHIPEPVLEETVNAEAGEPFLRTRQRVPVRRRGGSRFGSRFSWKNWWVRLTAGLIIAASIGILATAAWEAKSGMLRNPRFFLTSAQNIQVSGNRVVTADEVLTFFTPDIGHSIFHVPLAERKAELQQIRWVRQATVMRLWPDRLRVNVLERTPIAFARDGNSIRLVDDEGVLLDLPAAVSQHYSFPVLTGVSSSETLAVRSARIRQYRQFLQALDAEGGHISNTLSEVDLSDPEDVRVLFSGGTHQPLVHFGDTDFLPRYHAYQAHLPEWLQQYPQLRSVDLRYGRHVVLDTGVGAPPPAEPPDMKKTAAMPPVASTISKENATQSKTRTESVKKSTPVKHPEKVHQQTPERGHPVNHPLMHVLTKK
jgi:cell division protein FtsQ